MVVGSVRPPLRLISSSVSSHSTSLIHCARNSHSRYVDNHPECASDLAAYLKDHPESARRLAKRASHHEMAQKLQKKGQQTYYIVAVDHILVRSPLPCRTRMCPEFCVELEN